MSDAKLLPRRYLSALIPGVLIGVLLSGCAGGPQLKSGNTATNDKYAEQQSEEVDDLEEQSEAPEPAETEAVESTMAEVEAEPLQEDIDVAATATEETASQPVEAKIESNVEIEVKKTPPVMAQTQKSTAPVAAVATTAATSAQTAPKVPAQAITQPANVTEPEAAPVEDVSANGAVGTRFGIWTVAKSEQGNCMLTTPTFQVRDGDFTSQFWIDLEKNRFIVNASLTLKTDPKNSGIKFDGGKLITFDVQELPTRVVINKDLTQSIATGSKLSVYLKSEELGDKILVKDISLKNTAAATASLKACK